MYVHWHFQFHFSSLRCIVVLFCRGVFFIGGFHWISTKGQLASPEEAPILVTAPHSTYFDALPVVLLQLSTVVAKSAVERVFIFGSMLCTSSVWSLAVFGCAIVYFPPLIILFHASWRGMEWGQEIRKEYSYESITCPYFGFSQDTDPMLFELLASEKGRQKTAVWTPIIFLPG